MNFTRDKAHFMCEPGGGIRNVSQMITSGIKSDFESDFCNFEFYFNIFIFLLRLASF